MKLVFKIDRFIDWCYLNGSTEHKVRKMLEQYDWGKYEGMTYEEVRKEEVAIMREWFVKEETK